MKTTFLLLDFENVQPKNMEFLSRTGGPVKIRVFHGTHQGRIPIEVVNAIQVFGRDAEYVEVDAQGKKNALDFHIAYSLGRLTLEHPGARFRVISKDTGFDPLLKHLKSRQIDCERVDPTRTPTAAQTSVPGSISIPEQADRVVSNFGKRKTAKPRTLASLQGTVSALFGKQIGDAELGALIDELARRGVLQIVDGKVSYPKPG